jgi:hypothetical protein
MIAHRLPPCIQSTVWLYVQKTNTAFDVALQNICWQPNTNYIKNTLAGKWIGLFAGAAFEERLLHRLIDSTRVYYASYNEAFSR